MWKAFFFKKDKLSLSYVSLNILKYFKILSDFDLFYFFLRQEIFNWFNEKNKSFFFLCLLKISFFYFKAVPVLMLLLAFTLYNSKEPFFLNFTFTFFYLSFVLYYSNFSGFEPTSILYVIFLLYFLRDFLYFIYYWFFWVLNYLVYSFVCVVRNKISKNNT